MRRGPWLAIVGVAAACGGKRDASPSLLVRRDVGGEMRLIQVPAAGGEERDVLSGVEGSVLGALVVDGGRSVLAIVDGPRRELWRVDVGGRAPVRVWDRVPTPRLDSADRTGRVVSTATGLLMLLDGEPRVEDRIASGETSAYNAQFVPGTNGGELLFNRVQPDAACPGPWACRAEEIVRIGFDGRGERMLHPLAWTPHVSPDRRTIAVATMPDHRLAVGPIDGDLTAIADDAMWAEGWSPDGSWIAYHRFGGDGDAAIVRRDGSGKRVIAGRPVGWIAGALAGEPIE